MVSTADCSADAKPAGAAIAPHAATAIAASINAGRIMAPPVSHVDALSTGYIAARRNFVAGKVLSCRVVRRMGARDRSMPPPSVDVMRRGPVARGCSTQTGHEPDLSLDGDAVTDPMQDGVAVAHRQVGVVRRPYFDAPCDGDRVGLAAMESGPDRSDVRRLL